MNSRTPACGTCTLRLAPLTGHHAGRAASARPHAQCGPARAAPAAAFRRLRVSLQEEGRWAELSRLFERRAEGVDHPTEAIHCLLCAGDLWFEAAQDNARAIECYRRVLGAEASNAVALEALEDVPHFGGCQ